MAPTFILNLKIIKRSVLAIRQRDLEKQVASFLVQEIMILQQHSFPLKVDMFYQICRIAKQDHLEVL